MHYYAQGHPDAVALIVAGRYPYLDGSVPIWRIVESERFELRFGNAPRTLFPDFRMQLRDSASLFGDISQQARASLSPPSKKIWLRDRQKRPFIAEAFYNQRCQFVLLVDSKARLLGRRARLEHAPALA